MVDSGQLSAVDHRSVGVVPAAAASIAKGVQTVDFLKKGLAERPEYWV